jgi:peroxiredoxin
MRHDIKPFLALVLCGALATSFSTLAMSDDGQAAPATPATPTQEETPAANPAAKPRGERRPRGQGAQAATGTGKAGAKIGAAAPAFTLKTTDGKDWSLSDAKGKVVVIEWVNPECPVCRGLVKDGTVAATEKGCKAAFPDVVYLAINSSASSKSSLDATGAYLKDNKLDVIGLIDTDGKVGRSYGARTTPHCFVINAEGVLVYQGAINNSQGGDGKTNYVVDAVKQLKAGSIVTPSETKPFGCGVKY